MELKDFRYFDKALHCIHFTDPDSGLLPWMAGDEVRLVNESGTLVIGQRDLVAMVEAVGTATNSLAASSANVWRIAQKAADHLQLELLPLQMRIHENLNIAVDGYVSSQLYDEGCISSKDIDEANDWLKDEFIVDGGQPFAIAQTFRNESEDVLQLIGRHYSLTLKKEDNLWVAKRLTKLRRDARNFISIVGDITFVDASVAAEVASWGVDALEQHINDTGSYLSLWEEYSKIQWQQATRAAKRLGYFSYAQQEHTGGETPRFRFNIGQEQAEELQNRLGALRESDELDTSDLTFEIAEELPEWLLDSAVQTNKGASGQSALFGKNYLINPPFIEVEVKQRRPPQKGVLFLSIQGDKTAHDRREGAYTAIRMRTNPMPQLSMLLEGIESPIERRKGFRARKEGARKRFRGELTPIQKQAVNVALTTPDVALIIGPPGTGKTQVITALQQRIAEEFSREHVLTHQVLLTSFQHDAVDNVVERSGVFGLPAVKVGGRRFGGDSSGNSITQWRLERLRELKPDLDAALKSEPVFVLYEKLKVILLNLRMARQPAQRKLLASDVDEHLKKLTIEHGILLTQKVLDDWYTTLKNLNNGPSFGLSNSNLRKLLRLIRGLRTLVVSYEDDGFQRLQDLLEFSDKLQVLNGNSTIQKLIQLGTDLQSDDVSIEDIAGRTLAARDELIDLVRPDYRPYLLRSYMSEADSQTIDNLEKAIYSALAGSRTLGSLMVRYEYLNELQERHDEVERSVKDYAAIVGATCQQAAGEQMVGIKEVADRLQVSFDTVIVDEAARAAPLDLMIPMSMASRRIVLVGDHLQLPHMLEPRVETELQERQELDTIQSELLRISLFENMHRKFLAMHKAGGPNRVVMLDTQFRMHPELGRFVSREFYERRGFEPILSGLPEEVFEHEIKDYGGCIAAWLDVSKDQGRERKEHGSWVRRTEAKRSALEAHKILNSHPELSVGVITFYSAQRDAIYEELEKLGCAVKIEDSWQISSEYRMNSQGEERLRVGSVDAFQGKEFDVVILSVVRTWNVKTEISEDGLNRKLGFLRLPNRVNVAMSRQKKLLIVVGDKELSKVNDSVVGDDTPLLPGFPAFYELCRGQYGQVL